MFALNKAVTSIPTQQVYSMPWGKKAKNTGNFEKLPQANRYINVSYTPVLSTLL